MGSWVSPGSGVDVFMVSVSLRGISASARHQKSASSELVLWVEITKRNPGNGFVRFDYRDPINGRIKVLRILSVNPGSDCIPPRGNWRTPTLPGNLRLGTL